MGLSVREKVSYGLGAVGKDMVYAFVSGFLMYYYNTVLGISATFIGVLFMVARIFDAVNDPFMGIVVEKTRTRYGKFRPWLLIGTIINAAVLYAMYSVPEGLEGNSLLVYASIAYIVWGVTYTIMDIPYWSMIPAITEPGKERENISVIARSCAGLGFAIPTALALVLVPLLGGGDESLGFSRVSLLVCAFFIIGILATVTNVNEKHESKQKAATVKEMFVSLIHNDQAMVVVVAIIVFNASLYLTNQLAIYFFRFDIGNVELFGLFATVGGAVQVLSMISLPMFRKKFGCKRILIGAIITTLVGYTMLFTLGILNNQNIILLCVAAIIIFFGFGLATVLTTIFLADTVDYGQWKNGQRNESVVFSLQTFVVKLASAISVFIAGIGLDFIKLDKDAAIQTVSTLSGLRILMIIVPMVGLLISIIFFAFKYKLTENRMNEIMGEIKDRQEEVANDK